MPVNVHIRIRYLSQIMLLNYFLKRQVSESTESVGLALELTWCETPFTYVDGGGPGAVGAGGAAAATAGGRMCPLCPLMTGYARDDWVCACGAGTAAGGGGGGWGGE